MRSEGHEQRQIEREDRDTTETGRNGVRSVNHEVRMFKGQINEVCVRCMMMIESGLKLSTIPFGRQQQ
jgi:hypothetical protein